MVSGGNVRMASLPAGTVTFLFTDIEGSTTLLQRLGDRRYAEVLEEHRRLLRAAFEEGRGQEVDTQGDAFLVAFSRARDAVGAAVAAQRALTKHGRPDGRSLKVRMALHTGEPVSETRSYVGPDVRRAARICAAVHGIKPARRGGLKVPHRVRLGYGRGFTPSGILRGRPEVCLEDRPGVPPS